MARKGEPPAYLQYAGDFISQTFGMSPAARGVLVTLEAHLWIRKELPVAEDELARFAGVTPRELRAVWPAISKFFELASHANVIVSTKLLAQRSRLDDKSEKSSKAAKAKWEKDASASASASVDVLRPHPSLESESGSAVSGSASETDRVDPPPRPLTPYQQRLLTQPDGVNRTALAKLWKDATGIQHPVIPGLEAAAQHLDEYCRAVPGADPLDVAGRALPLFVRWCRTRSEGFQPPTDGYKFVEHWAHIEPALTGKGKLGVSAARGGGTPRIIAGLDFSRKDKS